jgi:hypothetical protein
MEPDGRAHGLRIPAALSAARDFGLDPERAAEITRSVDPRVHGFERFVEALWLAVLGDTVGRQSA